MVLGPLFLFLAAILTAPDTQIGKFLHHFMVQRPAAALSRMTHGDVLRGAVLVLVAVIAFWILQDDGLRPLAGFGSDAVAWIVTLDVTAYLEAAAAMVLVASALRRVVRVQLNKVLPRRVARSGGREVRSRGAGSSRAQKADNDNEEDSRGQAD